MSIEKKTRIRCTRKLLPNAGSAQGCTRILLQRDVGKATSRTRPIHSKKTMWCTRAPHKAAQDHTKPHKAAQGHSGSEEFAQVPHKARTRHFTRHFFQVVSYIQTCIWKTRARCDGGIRTRAHKNPHKSPHKNPHKGAAQGFRTRFCTRARCTKKP